jgi:beta-glucosidase
MEQTTEERLEDLLSQMRLDEKLSLLAGENMWYTRSVERLGVPAVRMTDGPHGVTVSGDMSGPATCFPTAVGMAATWNVALLEQVGGALAREAQAKGNRVLLGPSVDLHRSPLNGRNYESYSEDPLLSGELAVAYVRGVQREGVAACIKHCTANNQQTEQSKTSSEVAERALRELYLRPWEIAVKKQAPWMIMTSYNLLNGQYTSAHHQLLTEIVKQAWGYDGMVVSDWRGVHGVEAATAGLDLEMPGPGRFLTREALLPLVESGRLPLTLVDDKVRRILRMVSRTGALDGPLPAGELDSPRHRQLARQVAGEGIVLLKNDNGVLPLQRSALRRLAVIGPNAGEARLGGGGSSSTTSSYAISPLQGLRNICGDRTEILYAEGCSFKGNMPLVPGEFLRSLQGMGAGLSGQYFNGPELVGQPELARLDERVDFSWGWSSPGGDLGKEEFGARWLGELVPPESGRYVLGLSFQDGDARLFVDDELLIDAWEQDGSENFEGLYSSQSLTVEVAMTAGCPRELRVEYRKRGNKAAVRLEWQRPNQQEPIEAAAQLAAGADAAVVFVGLSNQYEGGNHDKTSIDLPGQQAALIAAVASANPHTVVVLINGSPVAMDRWIAQVPAVLEAYYPGQEGGNAIADVLFGAVNPSGKLPESFPRRLEDNPTHGNFPGVHGKVHYDEGIFVGYRHYDTRGIEPLFPFGHGLSYTGFEYGDLTLSPGPKESGEQGDLLVSVRVRNCGEVAGKEIVQLYVSDLECSLVRPRRELKAFAKIHLEPGAEEAVSFQLNREDFCYFDSELNHWIAEPGEFEIQVGGSSRDGLTAKFNLGSSPS